MVPNVGFPKFMFGLKHQWLTQQSDLETQQRNVWIYCLNIVKRIAHYKLSFKGLLYNPLYHSKFKSPIAELAIFTFLNIKLMNKK